MKAQTPPIKSNARRNTVGKTLNAVHPAYAARPKRPIGQEAGDEKESGICGEEIIREGDILPSGNHNLKDADYSQAHAYHSGGHSEDVNTDVRFQRRSLVGLWHISSFAVSA